VEVYQTPSLSSFFFFFVKSKPPNLRFIDNFFQFILLFSQNLARSLSLKTSSLIMENFISLLLLLSISFHCSPRSAPKKSNHYFPTLGKLLTSVVTKVTFVFGVRFSVWCCLSTVRGRNCPSPQCLLPLPFLQLCSRPFPLSSSSVRPFLSPL